MSDKPSAGKITLIVALISLFGVVFGVVYPDLRDWWAKNDKECKKVIEQSTKLEKEIEKRLPFLETEMDSLQHLFYLDQMKSISRYSCDNIENKKSAIDAMIDSTKKLLNL